jgi:hypothetical protein
MRYQLPDVEPFVTDARGPSKVHRFFKIAEQGNDKSDAQVIWCIEKKSVDVNCTDKNGGNVAHHAVARNRADLLIWLVQHGVNINHPDKVRDDDLIHLSRVPCTTASAPPMHHQNQYTAGACPNSQRPVVGRRRGLCGRPPSSPSPLQNIASHHSAAV